MKILQTIAASVLVLGMGSAFAAEPAALNDTQMDSVTSGFAWASGGGTGTAFFGTTSSTNTTTASHYAANCPCNIVYDTASTSSTANASGFLVSSSTGGTAYAQ